MKGSSRFPVLLAALLSGACGHPPRPAVLDEVDRTRTAAPAKEAESLAPQAYLAAEKLRDDAARAAAAGDRAGAEILGEHALAAYSRAIALSRLARADDRLARATARVREGGLEVTALEEKQHRLAAEADDVELRFRVARDALPVARTAPVSAERELARLTAAKALALEARLLCVATQMLAPDSPGVTAAFQGIADLDAELQKRPARAPLDAAVQLRSACLSELARVRRSAAEGAPGAGTSDALLEELGRATFEPRRDDRGIAVTLRGAFTGNGALPTPAGRERLTALGQVARAHPAFPVLVVVHAAKGAPSARDTARAEAVQKALLEAGAPRVKANAGGDALPVALPSRADSAARNERVEIVFVAPVP